MKTEEKLKTIINLVREMTVPECTTKENSEYHHGFNDARYAYAEEKLKTIKLIKKLI